MLFQKAYYCTPMPRMLPSDRSSQRNAPIICFDAAILNAHERLPYGYRILFRILHSIRPQNLVNLGSKIRFWLLRHTAPPHAVMLSRRIEPSVVVTIFASPKFRYSDDSTLLAALFRLSHVLPPITSTSRDLSS